MHFMWLAQVLLLCNTGIYCVSFIPCPLYWYTATKVGFTRQRIYHTEEYRRFL